MHDNIPIPIRIRLPRTPHPHRRARIMSASVENTSDSNSDVNTTNRERSEKLKRFPNTEPPLLQQDSDRANSPRRRSLDANSTGPDPDDLGSATLAERSRDPSVRFAGLRAERGQEVGALRDVGGVGLVAGASYVACESRCWQEEEGCGGEEGGGGEMHLWLDFRLVLGLVL